MTISDFGAIDAELKVAEADDIERPFDAGRILRTHVMRPTSLFVTPDDIR